MNVLRRCALATVTGVPGSSPKWWTSPTANAVVVALAALVAGRFLVHYALPYYKFDPKFYDYFWPHRFRLLLHISGGIVALICGTLQLWTGLRRKAMTFHRWTGRVYVGAVAVGASGAFLMTYYTTPRAFGVALMGLATAWLLTTGIAWAAIVRGQMLLHKEWMVRSYLVTFAFVWFRFIQDNLPGLTARMGSSGDDAASSVAWLSWTVPLAVYEVVLQGRRLFGAGARRVES